MEDLKFLKGLNPGDHAFIPAVEHMSIGWDQSPDLPGKPEEAEIEKRWKDFVGEGKSAGLTKKDNPLVCTVPENWSIRKVDGNYVLDVGVFEYSFKPWVTIRPAFEYRNGKKAGPVGDYFIYSVGTGAMFFVIGGKKDYLILGSRRPREVGGEIDTPPAGFLKIHDMDSPDPDIEGLLRESEEEIVNIDYNINAKIDGAMVSDKWRNLTACFEARTNIGYINNAFDMQEQYNGLIILKKSSRRKSKYGDGLFMVPVRSLDRYVSEEIEKHGPGRFGERASLLLRRYFERA